MADSASNGSMKSLTGHEEEFNVVFNYCSVTRFPYTLSSGPFWEIWIGLAQPRALTRYSYCKFEQGNSRDHQLQLGESSNWLQMGVLFEHEYKKLIVIHRVIFKEVEPENEPHETVSRVQTSTQNCSEISFWSVKFTIKGSTAVKTRTVHVGNLGWLSAQVHINQP